MILYVSTVVGEAVFSCGALIAQQVSRGHQVAMLTVYPAALESEYAAVLKEDKAVGSFLGIQTAHWAVEGGLDRVPALVARLQQFIDEHYVHTVLISKNLGAHVLHESVQAAVLKLRTAGVPFRLFSWYDQPHVAQHKGDYPELAFAQRVNGLAEIGDQACNFMWPSSHDGAGDSPLALKLQAMAIYESLIEETFYKPFEFTYKAGEDVKLNLAMIIGRKEWFELQEG